MVEWREEGEFLFEERLAGVIEDANLQRHLTLDRGAGKPQDEREIKDADVFIEQEIVRLALRGRPGLPTIVAAGPPITTPGGHCHYLGGGAEPTEAGARAAVREHMERGVDVIKIMASGGTLTPGTYQHLCQFTPEVLRVEVEEAPGQSATVEWRA